MALNLCHVRCIEQEANYWPDVALLHNHEGPRGTIGVTASSAASGSADKV